MGLAATGLSKHEHRIDTTSARAANKLRSCDSVHMAVLRIVAKDLSAQGGHHIFTPGGHQRGIGRAIEYPYGAI